MRQITSAGILLFRDAPARSFLLVRSGRRWDVPKGHVERGETEQTAALRELHEETGIRAEQVTLDPDFRFQTNLKFKAAYLGGQFVDKTYVVFLGHVETASEIKLTEHDSYEWFLWNPPHHIQKFLIDPLLEAASRHFELEQR